MKSTLDILNIAKHNMTGKEHCKCGYAGAKAIYHMMRARHVAPWDTSFDQEKYPICSF